MVETKPRNNRIQTNQISFARKTGKSSIRILADDNYTSIFPKAKTNVLEKSQADIRKAVKNYQTEANQKVLREASESLYVQSQQYQRLINYYGNMPNYSYTVVPFTDIEKVAKSTIKKDFKNVTEFSSRFNIKYNFNKIAKIAMKLDIFFGYIIEDTNGVSIQQFPNEICSITSMSNGVFDFAINLDEIISKKVEAYYPDEIQKAISRYQKDKKKNKSSWYEVDSRNSICIKINETTSIPTPPFVAVFDSIYDINAYKNLRNDKAELQNYKLLVQKLGVRNDTSENNDFTLDMGTMNLFHSALANAVPDNVGVVTSPMAIDTVTFDKDTSNDDGVEKAEKSFWDASGTSQILFSSDNKTSQGINMSIKTDEQVVFGILNQFERWFNRHLLFNGYSKNFKIKMLEVTNFSVKEMQDALINGSQYGFPVKMALSALYGIEPVAFNGLLKVENEILDLPKVMIPLSSSFNTSGSDITDTGGRPKNADNGKADSDETQRGKDKPDNTSPAE